VKRRRNAAWKILFWFTVAIVVGIISSRLASLLS
jgi:hypothetical protein